MIKINMIKAYQKWNIDYIYINYTACFFILRAVASRRCWSHVTTCLYMYIFGIGLIVPIESLIIKK